jgi:hypothetical protein
MRTISKHQTGGPCVRMLTKQVGLFKTVRGEKSVSQVFNSKRPVTIDYKEVKFWVESSQVGSPQPLAIVRYPPS